ncbi:MAG: uroporphyrinogen decarboxylase [Candidatus Obscuribacterales bacterium]|nr:uroporphyrinogen decarboxylase [Candidatus Obscuribacterales bacterium]
MSQVSITKESVLAQAPFMQACRRDKASRTPIWLMRQAGRFMPEYREIRSKVKFLDLCKNSQLASEVTVMAVEKLNVDAAIIFADLLLLVEPMGLGLEYAAGDGPVIHQPIRCQADLEKIQNVDPYESLGYVFEAIKLTRKALPANIPLIGFAGAPFTVASYIVEGGSSRHFLKTKQLMYTDSATWHILMQRIVQITIAYLIGQVEAGAQVIQLFDSWVGCLSPQDYRTYVMPHSKAIIDAVKEHAPVIHFGTGTATLLKDMKEAGGDVIGLDWRVELDQSWKELGYDVGVQGNLDPAILFSDKEEIRKQATRILKQAANRPGHIFNLGHGILPETPVENVQYLVETVRELG